MKILENIINFLQFEMDKPIMYGWFHLLSLIITIVIIIFLVYKKPNIKKVLLVMSIMMMVFEVYKQLSFSFNDGKWNYQWYIFPFQFCSTPMYVAFIAGITKNKKLENCLLSFLATYSVIAGLSVMLYPSTVFVHETLINVQTMMHHGFMVIMGVYVMISNSIKPNFKSLYSGFKVFLVLVIIALILDVTTYYLNIDNGLEMFFISPFHTSTLPVFSIIYDNVPYILFLIIYLVIFGCGAGVPLLLQKIFKHN